MKNTQNEQTHMPYSMNNKNKESRKEIINHCHRHHCNQTLNPNRFHR